MLNVPLEKCSAGELALLIKDWLTFDDTRAGFSVGFAARGLGDIYTKNAENFVKNKNGKLEKGAAVKKINFVGNKVRSVIVAGEDGEEKEIVADLFISCLSPIELRGVLDENNLSNDFFNHLKYFEGVPYISVNIWFDKKITDKKFWALLNDSANPDNINLDFYDKSNIYKNGGDTSYIASNIVYSHKYHSMSDREIVDKTLEEIKGAVPDLDAEVVRWRVHRIPYAIYAPYPGMRQHKLTNKTPYDNFYLAGDWTNKDMAQCMESAVWSGYKCVEKILEDLK